MHWSHRLYEHAETFKYARRRVLSHPWAMELQVLHHSMCRESIPGPCSKGPTGTVPSTTKTGSYHMTEQLSRSPREDLRPLEQQYNNNKGGIYWQTDRILENTGSSRGRLVEVQIEFWLRGGRTSPRGSFGGTIMQHFLAAREHLVLPPSGAALFPSYMPGCLLTSWASSLLLLKH